MATATGKMERERFTVECEPVPLKRKGSLVSQLKEIITCYQNGGYKIISCLVSAKVLVRSRRIDGICIRRNQNLDPHTVIVRYQKPRGKRVRKHK